MLKLQGQLYKDWTWIKIIISILKWQRRLKIASNRTVCTLYAVLGSGWGCKEVWCAGGGEGEVNAVTEGLWWSAGEVRHQTTFFSSNVIKQEIKGKRKDITWPESKQSQWSIFGNKDSSFVICDCHLKLLKIFDFCIQNYN